MPSLSIPFPEGTRTVALRGNNITIGRLPDNVIQIRDRAISAYHAELILEGNHYRIHDRSSTNGIMVGGQVVLDYHLREDCQIILGGLTCEFVAAAFPKSALTDMETLATRGEVHTVLQTNATLQKEVESLKSQVEAMVQAREAIGTSDGPGVPLAQHDQLAADAAALRSSLQERQTQIERLSALLAISNRERDTLQKAYDDARIQVDKLVTEATKLKVAIPVEAAPPMAKLASVPEAPAGNNPTIKVELPNNPTVRIDLSSEGAAPKQPAPPKIPIAPKVPLAPKAEPAPVAPPAPATASGAPPAALPKPPGVLGAGSPSRRPASGVMPAKPGGAAGLVAAASKLKSTQKISE